MRVQRLIYAVLLLFPLRAAADHMERPMVVACGNAVVTSTGASLLSLRIDEKTGRCNVSVNGASRALKSGEYLEVLLSTRRDLIDGQLSAIQFIDFLPFFFAASADGRQESEELIKMWHGTEESRYERVQILERCFEAAGFDEDIEFEPGGETFGCRSYVPKAGWRRIEIFSPSPIDNAIEYRFVIPVLGTQ